MTEDELKRLSRQIEFTASQLRRLLEAASPESSGREVIVESLRQRLTERVARLPVAVEHIRRQAMKLNDDGTPPDDTMRREGER